MQFQKTQLPDCNACGLPIRRGLEVTINKQTYHPGCAGRLMKEKKDAESQRFPEREPEPATVH